MNLIERTSAILLKPHQTWPVIEAEPATVVGLYKNYIALLACIPAVAGFIGMSLVGVGVGGIVSYRVPFLTGLVNMVVSYVLSLVMVYVLALIVNALAPKFNGQPNSINALKLVGYGLTAGFVGGIFSIVPALGALGILAALYTIYLIYSGIPVLMKCPPEKAVAYTAVVIVCGIVAALVIGLATSLLTPSASPLSRMGTASSDTGDYTVKIPGTDISINGRQMEQANRNIEEASKKVEAATARGDTQAAAEATTAMLGAVLGAATGQKGVGTGVAISNDQLKTFAPETLGGMARTSIEAESQSAMGMTQNTVKASYALGEKTIDVEISDYGDLGRLAAGAWSQRTLDRDTAEEVERIYRKGARAYNENWRKDGSYSSLEALLDNGVQVSLTGNSVDIKTLYSTLDAMGANKLAAIARQQAPQK